MTLNGHERYPHLAAEWHLAKNGGVTLDDFRGRRKKVWWICKRGHEWEVSIAERRKGTGCPYCAGKRACADNCLGTINPDLAVEWHPQKNDGLTPYEVMPYSRRKIWWRCKKGHEWEIRVAARSQGQGCPYCAGKRAGADK